MKIKPLKYPNLGTATQIKVTILNFTTEDITCNTYYELLDEEGNRIACGNYSLSQEEFNEWGSDNKYIVECVVKGLPDVEFE